MLETLFIQIMERSLGGRQGEDQPAVAGVHRRKLQDVAEEGAVAFRIGAVEDDVGAVDHGRPPLAGDHRLIAQGGFASVSELNPTLRKKRERATPTLSHKTQQGWGAGSSTE